MPSKHINLGQYIQVYIDTSSYKIMTNNFFLLNSTRLLWKSDLYVEKTMTCCSDSYNSVVCIVEDVKCLEDQAKMMNLSYTHLLLKLYKSWPIIVWDHNGRRGEWAD